MLMTSPVNNHHCQSVTSTNFRGSTAPPPQKLGSSPVAGPRYSIPNFDPVPSVTTLRALSLTLCIVYGSLAHRGLKIKVRSTYVLDSPHVQPLSRSSLVFPLVLNPQLHVPYISSPSHRHLFATHDMTSYIRTLTYL